MTVTALLVCHDGARWLPTVLAGVQGQTRPADRVVAIDTGSTDDTLSLLSRALPRECVLYADPGTGFGDAVAIAAEASGDHEWLWILHDDANPDPTALQHLLAAAAEHPDADILGPKLREWPSLRRLLEVGVTISGTGRRETGLERGEYDQGQHDELREVLAVNSAGMLVRREVLERLGGFDRNLPVFGNDVDLGWRAALAGHRTLVVPQAVVFHAEAAHRGVRRTGLTGRHTHFQERRAALYTLLANSRAGALPFQVVRLAVGTLLRAVGLLLVRAPREAGDELGALFSLYLRPGEVRRARRDRRELTGGERSRVRSLLPPAWLPYRHGLDFVSDILVATTHQAQDVAERRRAAALAEGSAVRPRRSEGVDDDELIEDTGWAARFLTNPRAVLATLFVLVALVGARPALGPVSGGALSPAPEQAGDWWRLYTEHWHALGTGTDAPAPAYLPALASLASLLGGRPSLAVTAVLLLAVPVTFWGAWRFLRVVGRLVHPHGLSRWVLLMGATTYALVPVTSGAWGEGRLGTVVTAAVLPWLAHAALGFADPEGERRWRAAWRTGFLLAVATAFTPSLWWFAVVLGLLAVLVAWRISPSSVRHGSVVGPPLVAVAAVPLLLAPWVVPLLVQGPRGGLLLETGRPPSATPAPLDLLTGRVTDLAIPFAWGAALLVLALLALLPAAGRLPALAAWLVALVAVVSAVAISHVPLGLEAAGAWAGVGVFAVLLVGAWVTAAVVGLPALPAAARGSGRALTAVLVLVAAALPVVGLVWFAAGGHDVLSGSPDDDIPAYMEQSSELGPAHGVLILEGSVEDGLTYVLRRGDGLTLGEDEILALTPEDRAFSETVQSLLADPTTTLTNRLSEQGVEYVVLRAPADGRVAAKLDATPGLSQASAEDRATRAWQVERTLDGASLTGPGSVARTVLLWLQLAFVVAVLVLCGPTRRPSR